MRVYLIGNTPPESAGSMKITNTEDIVTNCIGVHGIATHSSHMF